MTGPSSSRSQAQEDEQMEDALDETQTTPHSRTETFTHTRREPIYMSAKPNSGGVWWDDKPIKELLGHSFTVTYDEYVTNWTSATPSQQDKMFNYFRPRVRTDPGYDLRKDYEDRIKKRITVPITRASRDEKRPNWMPLGCFDLLLKRKEDPKFKAKAEKAQANRMKGGSGGKAPPTSTLGQNSATQVFNALGKDATPHNLLLKSKRNKKGEWISPRAEQIDADFQRLRAEHDPSGQMSDAEYRAYLEAAGGFDNRSRIFGLGRMAKELFVPPRASRSQAGGESSYIPSIISQYASRNAELEERMTQIQTQAEDDRRKADERMAALEARLVEQFRCNPGPTPGPRDDFADDGHGFSSQHAIPLH